MDGLTYAEVGATRTGSLPAGYRHLTYRAAIGAVDLATAGDAILSWRMHEAAGVRIYASAPQAAPGVTVTSAIGSGPLRLRVGCRVVWAERGDDRAGFGYGTLANHPFCGEESFVVTRRPDGTVWFAVTAFSRPARWYVRAGGPVTGALQRTYAARLATALRRLTRGSSSQNPT